MMNMPDNSHIQDIILRFLNGEASDEEARILQDWIAESPTNKDEFEQTQRLWTDSTDAALLPVNVDSAWESVRERTVATQGRVVKMFPWKRAIAIAASVILIVGGYYLFNQPVETKWNVTLAENGNKKISLPDGTMITMRKGSKISVPDNYNEAKREIKLEGEAYFEVKHDEQKPFSTLTSKSIIRDIGTSFLVHSSDSVDIVTVLEGTVSFAAVKQNENAMILKAGESAKLKKDTPEKENADTVNALSWESGILNFNNTPLSLVARDLEDYYEIRIEMPEELGALQITAEFSQQPVEEVLKELQLFTGLKFIRSGDKVMISK